VVNIAASSFRKSYSILFKSGVITEKEKYLYTSKFYKDMSNNNTIEILVEHVKNSIREKF